MKAWIMVRGCEFSLRASENKLWVKAAARRSHVRAESMRLYC
jgi:hypothetical protein